MLKISLSYANPPFDTRALTHFIDSCRSATVCWAILREPKTVAKAVARSREDSLRPASIYSQSPRKQSIDQSNTIISSFGPIEEDIIEEFEGTNINEGIPLTSSDTLGTSN